jgi:hypothetical protein
MGNAQHVAPSYPALTQILRLANLQFGLELYAHQLSKKTATHRQRSLLSLAPIQPDDYVPKSVDD